MESRTLEITLQHATDLSKVNLFTKMDVYAVVSISGAGDKNSTKKTKTPVDRDGRSNPTWNFPAKFTVDEAALQQNRLTLDIKIVCDRLLGDKEIGEVHVSVKELLDSQTSGFVSYQVRKPSGKPKGQITFSCRFGEKIVGEPVVAYPAIGPGTNAYAPQPPNTGYGYAPPQPGYGYPPPPPPPGYGYPPPPPGYGYGPPVQQPAKKNKFGLGLGAGLLGGALGGLLIGDMVSDIGGGFDGGFDF